MINIVSSFFVSNTNQPELDDLRTAEISDCILKNVSLDFVEKIHLFVDNIESLNYLIQATKHTDKIVIIKVGKRPKYTDFYHYILHNLKNNICMITNTDIYLYECDTNLIESLKHSKIAYAITRHEHDMSKITIDPYRGSHDSYIFNSKFINDTIINEHTDFHQNILGIESHVIKNLHDQGFRMLNPCEQIKIVHLHKTNVRSYGCEWIGLHNDDEIFRQSPWCVPPQIVHYDEDNNIL